MAQNGGNKVPSIVAAEHIGPDATGDNIEAKRAANYVWDSNSSTWVRATQATSGGGDASAANQTNGNQQTKITDGTNVANTLKSDGTAAGQNSVLTAGTYLSVPFTTTTVQAVGSTDVGNYKWVSVHITSQGTSSTITYQGSNDNTNWVNVTVLNSSTVGTSVGVSSDTTANVIRSGALNYRYFRLNVTGISAGTTAGTIMFFTVPPTANIINAAATQVGTWTVGSNSATGSAVPANAFYVAGVDPSGNLAGVRTLNASTNTVTGILAAGISGVFDDVAPTAITENQFGPVRMSANRNLYGTIRDAAGNERGANVTANSELNVIDPASSATGSGVPTKAMYGGFLARATSPSAGSSGNLIGGLADVFGSQMVTTGGIGTTAVAATTATDTVIKGSVGRLCKVIVTATGTNPMQIYNNASAGSGTIIGALPASPAVGNIYDFQVYATTGITVKGDANNPGVTITWV